MPGCQGTQEVSDGRPTWSATRSGCAHCYDALALYQTDTVRPSPCPSPPWSAARRRARMAGSAWLLQDAQHAWRSTRLRFARRQLHSSNGRWSRDASDPGCV